MNQRIIDLIEQLTVHSMTSMVYCQHYIKTKINILNVHAHQSESHLVKKDVLNLIPIISNTYMDQRFIEIFSELVLEIFDQEIRNNNDITDLINAMDRTNISSNINDQVDCFQQKFKIKN